MLRAIKDFFLKGKFPKQNWGSKSEGRHLRFQLWYKTWLIDQNHVLYFLQLGGWDAENLISIIFRIKSSIQTLLEALKFLRHWYIAKKGNCDRSKILFLFYSWLKTEYVFDLSKYFHINKEFQETAVVDFSLTILRVCFCLFKFLAEHLATDDLLHCAKKENRIQHSWPLWQN